jgi:hypothetical protein
MLPGRRRLSPLWPFGRISYRVACVSNATRINVFFNFFQNPNILVLVDLFLPWTWEQAAFCVQSQLELVDAWAHRLNDVRVESGGQLVQVMLACPSLTAGRSTGVRITGCLTPCFYKALRLVTFVGRNNTAKALQLCWPTSDEPSIMQQSVAKSRGAAVDKTGNWSREPQQLSALTKPELPVASLPHRIRN